MPVSVLLTPIGEIGPELPAQVRGDLAAATGGTVTLERSIPLSPSWYDEARDQYLGPELLRALDRVQRPEQGRVLGLVDADCYASGLNFVFGQAAPGRGTAFVALPRLRPSFYGSPEDPERFHVRVLKEAVHELGHTWGLPHCGDPGCVMHFSNRLQDTDVKAARFCASCRGRLSFTPPSN